MNSLVLAGIGVLAYIFLVGGLVSILLTALLIAFWFLTVSNENQNVTKISNYFCGFFSDYVIKGHPINNYFKRRYGE